MIEDCVLCLHINYCVYNLKIAVSLFDSFMALFVCDEKLHLS